MIAKFPLYCPTCKTKHRAEIALRNGRWVWTRCGKPASRQASAPRPSEVTPAAKLCRFHRYGDKHEAVSACTPETCDRASRGPLSPNEQRPGESDDAYMARLEAQADREQTARENNHHDRGEIPFVRGVDYPIGGYEDDDRGESEDM